VRIARGLALRETGELAGVDPGYLSRIERGLQQPSVEVLARLARALELRELQKLLEPYTERNGE
jgi:transcriptional regulator with XRE-family HTH domain